MRRQDCKYPHILDERRDYKDSRNVGERQEGIREQMEERKAPKEVLDPVLEARKRKFESNNTVDTTNSMISLKGIVKKKKTSKKKQQEREMQEMELRELQVSRFNGWLIVVAEILIIRLSFLT